MEKKLSCGVLLTDGKRILLGHPFMSRFWDVPKGELNTGEKYIETAIREFKEETNLTVTRRKLVGLGKFTGYSKKKDLVLFLYWMDELPDISKLKCNSTFERNGKRIPEFDKFKYCNMKEVKEKVTPNLFKILRKCKTLTRVIRKELI